MDYVAEVIKHGSIRAAAKFNGVPETSFRHHYHLAEAAQKPLVEGKERMVFEDKIRNLERRLREVSEDALTAEKISSYYFNANDKDLVEPDWVLDLGSKTGVAGVPVTTWSDWHFAEVVNPSQVEGANAFDIPIFNRRFAMLVERTIDLCENHMTGKEYPGIIVNLGGDMLSGNIHEELKNTNELEVIPAALELAGKIAWGLRRYADYFGRVFVPCVVGNHGRNTMKPQAKNTCYTSFDWLVYKMLDAHFHPMNMDGSRADGYDDRVHFMIPNGFDAYYRVFAHRVLLTHGDRIGSRGGDGFIGAIGPIMRGAHKLRLSYSNRGREIDTLIMGHWHNEVTLPGLRVNNCLKGYDEWAMSMRFSPTAPGQDLFFIHPKRGVTCSWPIQVEKQDHLIESHSWASWKE